MAVTSLAIAAILAQSAFSLGLETQPSDQVDVGFEELKSGEPEAAIEAIESNKNLESDDPAALINLGNAHARLGRTDEAFRYYRAAAESKERYELQLEDGRWMDSRRAARLALNALQRHTEHAFRD